MHGFVILHSLLLIANALLRDGDYDFFATAKFGQGTPPDEVHKAIQDCRY